jgi:GNAT superfamily N-acetyltransferase
MSSDVPTRSSPASPRIADPPPPFRARLARKTDVPELVRLRSVMFESMNVDTFQTAWREPCRAHLEERLGDGTLIGEVVDRPDATGLAASALAELSRKIPAPSRPTGLSAYLASVSTDLAWRRRGMARAAVSLLLDELRARGVQRVELHSTPGGETLYRSLGFLPRVGGKEMRLVL